MSGVRLWSVFWMLVRYNVRSSLMYRGNFVMQQVLTLVAQFGQLYLIAAVLAQFHLIGGWTFGDLAFLIGLRLLAHGIYVFFCWMAITFVDSDLTSGAFIRHQVRPIPTLVLFLCQATNLSGVTIFGSGIVMVILATATGAVHWTLARVGLLVPVVAAGVIIEMSVFLAVACTAFWTGNSSPLFGVVYETLGEQFLLYPLNIYNLTVQLLLTVVPLGFISFYPAYSFLSLPAEPWSHWGLYSPLVAIAAFTLVWWLWRTSSGSYQGTGS